VLLNVCAQDIAYLPKAKLTQGPVRCVNYNEDIFRVYPRFTEIPAHSGNQGVYVEAVTSAHVCTCSKLYLGVIRIWISRDIVAKAASKWETSPTMTAECCWPMVEVVKVDMLCRLLVRGRHRLVIAGKYLSVPVRHHQVGKTARGKIAVGNFA
jgi:hypothetical protein